MHYSLWCVLGCYIDGILVAKLASLFIYLRKERVKRIDAYGWLVFRPEKKKSRRSKNCLRLSPSTQFTHSVFFLSFFLQETQH